MGCQCDVCNVRRSDLSHIVSNIVGHDIKQLLHEEIGVLVRHQLRDMGDDLRHDHLHRLPVVVRVQPALQETAAMLVLSGLVDSPTNVVCGNPIREGTAHSGPHSVVSGDAVLSGNAAHHAASRADATHTAVHTHSPWSAIEVATHAVLSTCSTATAVLHVVWRGVHAVHVRRRRPFWEGVVIASRRCGDGEAVLVAKLHLLHGKLFHLKEQLLAVF
mmetsp:Transcript_61200/g.71216  ORF Transcript_61200/g.71216 Transcript_61200/m.71216 type:complete len:217 (+) Transcript_61200:672-1322(+)